MGINGIAARQFVELKTTGERIKNRAKTIGEVAVGTGTVLTGSYALKNPNETKAFLKVVFPEWMHGGGSYILRQANKIKTPVLERLANAKTAIIESPTGRHLIENAAKLHADHIAPLLERVEPFLAKVPGWGKVAAIAIAGIALLHGAHKAGRIKQAHDDTLMNMNMYM